MKHRIAKLCTTALVGLGLASLVACAPFPDRGFVQCAPPLRATPILVTYVADPDHEQDLVDAATWWNDELGLDVLVLVGPDVERPDVVVSDGAYQGEDGAAGSSDPRLGLIRYHEPGDSYQAWTVFRHELGHAAFWLADDPGRADSIMYPAAAPKPGDPYVDRHVTRGDRARILRMLGRAP